MFSKIEVVPRWIIFAIDIILSVFALSLAVFVKHNLNVEDIDIGRFYESVILIITINTIIFYNIRTFAGIVRYTSTQDSFRILFAILISSLSIFFINALIIVAFKTHILFNVTIIVYSLFNFLFLITYRVIVKSFFMYMKNLNLDKKRVIIYGAGETGLATKRAFDHDAIVNKAIIAFVDDDIRKVGKTIEGIRILGGDILEKLIVKHEIDELIFASYSIPPERKERIVDVCLENSVKILNTPPIDVWASGDVKPAQIPQLNIEDLLNRKPIQIDIKGIQSQLHEKRILITGAAGSIGSEIVRQLLKFDTGLIIMCDQNETALHYLTLELEEKKKLNFQAFVGDVKDEDRMEFLFETYKPQYVYHAAAYKHVPMMEDNPVEAIKTNVLGTKTIADLAVKYGVQKFVMISTDKAVNPTNIMGASKRIAEIYVQSLNNALHQENSESVTKFITTRFGNVLGSNGSVIPRFKQQIEKGGPITVTHPEITRYFMTIPEACRLVLDAGCMGNGGEIFVFDMGKSVKIVELARKMIRLAGMVPDEDIKIVYSGLRPGEKLYEELLNDNENTMPTHHKQIMIGRVREYVFTEVESQINALVVHALINDNRSVVMQMKSIVPEFKSKNSRFEEFDVIIN